jgi:hypothetical protein
MGLGSGSGTSLKKKLKEYAHWAVVLLVAASEIETEHAKEDRTDGESNNEYFATGLGRQT